MEDCKREAKHIFLAKFKEGVTEEQIEECIKRLISLVDLFPSLKAFNWGKEMGIANFHQGFTHVFESTFESAEGLAGFMSHPHHHDYANFLLPQLEKFVAFDFQPTKVQP
ncbi:stress-response A/B barrel domain-containing protein HS1-like [Salvia miltiorrhiza]|uniref:stress-response A/B barrel domain-containing protein HS1-like n=1 Tax=Salvia miltiorrhiza TaxID=226208 RepID=UPI0025AD2A2F|nr:stress-response A/B barrel domain-containing protein HS1-like [Salvia miltiorrhiza]